MNFTYSLQFNTVPEWTEDYLSYGELKNAIHGIQTARTEDSKVAAAATPNGVTSLDMGSRSSCLEGEFFNLFQEDAQRVASAFTSKKLKCNTKYEDFLDSVSAKSENSSSTNLSDVSVNKIEVWTGDEDSLEKRRASLEDSFNGVYLSLHDLHDFLDLNYTGYVRVVKNYGKYVHATPEVKRELLSKIDSILPITELSEIQNKMGQVEDVYARVMCDGSITQARAALHLLLRDRLASLRQNGIPASPVESTEIVKSAPIHMSDSKTANQDRVIPVAAAPVQATPSKAAAPYFTKGRIGSLIVITLIFFAILLIPEKYCGKLIVGPKKRCLAILVSCVALWVTEAIPLYITALLIPALTVILQAIDETHLKNKGLNLNSAGEVSKFIFGSIFSDMIFLLLGGFSIAAVFQKYGITKTAAVFILKRLGKTPASTLLTVMVITVIASAFVSNVAAPVLCFGLIQPILKNLDYDHPFARALILGIAFAANIGGLASPIASPQSVFGSNELSSFFSFASWVVIAAPVCIISTLFCWFWLLKVYPSREVLNFREILSAKTDEKAVSAGTTIYILAIFAMTIVMWVAAPALEPIVGPMGITAIFPLVAYFGAGLLGKDDFNGFSWNVVILAVGGSALGKSLQYSNLLGAIGEIIGSCIGDMGFISVMCIFSTILLFITTFVSHSVGAFVFIPIIIEFAQTKGFANQEIALLALAACFTCSAGMAMPISGFPNMTAASLQDRKGRNYVATTEFAYGGVFPSIIFAVSIVGSVALLGRVMINTAGVLKTGGH